MMTLASDFTPMWTGLWWMFLLLTALVSLIPSARAHASGPVVAGLVLLLNLFLNHRSFIRGFGYINSATYQWLLYFSPLIVAAASMGLWYLAHRRRRRKAGSA